MGGLGAHNTAVADAQNATWKVAQVVKGHADPELLHSYEEERRPVARNVVEQSSAALGRQIGDMVKVIPALGPGQGGCGRTLARFFAETPEGEEHRALMARTVRKGNYGLRMLGLELGQQYVSGAVVPDGTEPEENPDPVIEYLAEARPGHRVPHAWLDRGSIRSSTIDLAQLDRFVLVTDPAGRRTWLQAIAAASNHVDAPVDLVTIGEGGDYEDSMGNWAQLSGLLAGGALLIRPDSFVGWRAATRPEDAAGNLPGSSSLSRATRASRRRPDRRSSNSWSRCCAMSWCRGSGRQSSTDGSSWPRAISASANTTVFRAHSQAVPSLFRYSEGWSESRGPRFESGSRHCENRIAAGFSAFGCARTRPNPRMN